MNDYAFDAAGNTTRDPHLRKFTYDAENKQTKVETVNSSGAVTGTIGEYFYDGDGRRVKKIAYSNNQVTETTVFVYDASSRLVAEYSTILNPTPQVAYLTNDHLGSPRINTNENGAVISRHDYRPYGEEITERTHAHYVGDTIRKQFTGYERDNETELDFAQARFYNDKIGRFNSTDPLLTTGRPFNPRTWNRYSYTLNNPLNFSDPTGLYECSGNEKECAEFAEGLKQANARLSKIEKFYGKDSKEYTDAKRALDSYGTLGDKNGVTVGFGTLSKGTLGSTIGTMSDRIVNGQKFTGSGANTVSVTIDLEQSKGGSDLLNTIAHEGSHVQDNSDYQGALLSASNVSLEAANAVMSGPLRVTHGQSETRAYGVSSVFAQFTLGGGTGESAITSGGGTFSMKFDLPPVKSTTVGGEAVWNSSWQKLDVGTIRKNRSAAIEKGLKKDPRYSPLLDKPYQ